MAEQFDVVVIGAGPAGSVAAAMLRQSSSHSISFVAFLVHGPLQSADLVLNRLLQHLHSELGDVDRGQRPAVHQGSPRRESSRALQAWP
ncbi:hypothetical protein [uncultured Methylobacterium sp.]|uniref:hypothetical protein n=1 Tax=uncultured Methylobacterium sp. TaxID=157278 RepID=UPI002593FF76|nr:hypothetical protein [uncultured Methylobacterium sp.]